VSTHPSETELVAYANGEATEAARGHVADCRWCRFLLADAAEPIPVPEADAWSPIPLVVPNFGSVPIAPEPGQLWRVAWNGETALAVVLRSDDRDVVVSPVLPDPESEADEWSTILDSGKSDLGFTVAVAVAHRFTLPVFTFDGAVGSLNEEGFDQVHSTWEAYADQTRPSSPTGPRVQGPLDPRAEAIGEVIDVFGSLAAASWLQEPGTAEATDWPGLLDAASDLIPLPRLLDLRRGAIPSNDEREIAASLGFALSAPPPLADLVEFLDLPLNSTALRRKATLSNISEESERRAAATFMTGREFAIAARGDRGATDWSGWFAEYLGAKGD